MDNDERNETNFSRFLSTERSDDTSPGTQPERRPNPGGRFDMRTLFVFCLLLYVVFDRCPSDSFVPVSASPLIRPCCCVHVTLLMIDDRTDIPLSRGSVVAQNVRLFQFAFHVFVDAVRVKHRRQPYDVCVCVFVWFVQYSCSFLRPSLGGAGVPQAHQTHAEAAQFQLAALQIVDHLPAALLSLGDLLAHLQHSGVQPENERTRIFFCRRSRKKKTKKGRLRGQFVMADAALLLQRVASGRQFFVEFLETLETRPLAFDSGGQLLHSAGVALRPAGGPFDGSLSLLTC